MKCLFLILTWMGLLALQRGHEFSIVQLVLPIWPHLLHVSVNLRLVSKANTLSPLPSTIDLSLRACRYRVPGKLFLVIFKPVYYKPFRGVEGTLTMRGVVQTLPTLAFMMSTFAWFMGYLLHSQTAPDGHCPCRQSSTKQAPHGFHSRTCGRRSRMGHVRVICHSGRTVQ